jgi:hypothetical protein
LIPSQTVSVLTPPSLVNTCFIVNSWFDPTSLVLLVEKTEENNRPVRKSLTNYREVYQVHLDKEKDWKNIFY